MIRKNVYPLDQILPLIGESSDVTIDGDVIRTSGLRLMNFKVHGITCVECGISGSFFAAEKSSRDRSYHLNLYAFDCDNQCEVLMTRDHIVPLSKNGPNSIENLQTMCVKCNNRKGNGDKDKRQQNSNQKSKIKIRRLHKELERLQLKINNGVTLHQSDLNPVIKFSNIVSCDTIITTRMSRIQPNVNLKEIDTFHEIHHVLGENISIIYNFEENNNVKKFYIYNKDTGDRLQVRLTKG
jgi:5-methylcytosine-specific restriction endonuclease McrA